MCLALALSSGVGEFHFCPWVHGSKSHLFSLFSCPFGRYGTQASLSGPYLTSVMGKEVGEREFWQLIRAPDTPLLQGESGGPPPLGVSPTAALTQKGGTASSP